MKTQVNRLIFASMIAATAAGLGAGCAWVGEKPVTLSQLSEPARATVNRETAGGRVDSILKEREKGRQVYDVEATVGGKHVEYTIAHDDGSIVGTETEIDFTQLPEPVRVAAATHFDSTSGLLVMLCQEYGETSYEIEGMRGGKKSEAMFDATGKRTE